MKIIPLFLLASLLALSSIPAAKTKQVELEEFVRVPPATQYFQHPQSLDPRVELSGINNYSLRRLQRLHYGTESRIRLMRQGGVRWPELVKLPQEYCTKRKKYANTPNEFCLLEPVAEAFIDMADSAKKDGINLKLVSGYRNFIEQNSWNVQKRNGEKKGAAKAGYSRHHTGMALDLRYENGEDEERIVSREDPAYQWLHQNAKGFGFSNPLGVEDPKWKTERWHWDYDTCLMKTRWYIPRITEREMERQARQFLISK